MSVITIILLIASIVTGGFLIFRAVSEDNPKALLRAILISILLLIVTFVQPFSLERIDAGNKGLKVNLISH